LGNDLAAQGLADLIIANGLILLGENATTE